MKHIYQLKIELRDSNPTIWRRIQVTGETTFSDLHDIIQLSMGWDHDHLYEFTVKKVKVFDFEEDIDDGSDPLQRDSMDTFLDDLVKKAKTKFTYVYDFGDHWEHVILVEKILPEDKNMAHPVCLDGERACPPEDCGGIWRYQDMLSILANRNHPKYNDIIEWIGEKWAPAFFDRDRTNALLKDYADQWEEIYKETDKIIENFEGKDLERGDLEHGLYDDEDDE